MNPILVGKIHVALFIIYIFSKPWHVPSTQWRLTDTWESQLTVPHLKHGKQHCFDNICQCRCSNLNARGIPGTSLSLILSRYKSTLTLLYVSDSTAWKKCDKYGLNQKTEERQTKLLNVTNRASLIFSKVQSEGHKTGTVPYHRMDHCN